MADGFFPEGLFTQAKTFSQSSRCGACGLFKKCHHPKLAPQGNGGRSILFVLPPVSEQEDLSGKFLQTQLGFEIKSILKRNNLSPLEDCSFTSAIICHTQQPSNEQIDFCSYKLRETISELQPNLIIPIGPAAIRSIVQFTWNKPAGKTDRWCGYQIPSQVINSWICPTYQPSFEERDNSMLFTTQHIEDSLQHCDSKPWDQLPDYESKVKVLYTEREIEKYLTPWIDKPFVAGFDYETTCIKPDNPKTARIVSGAFSFNGRKTYAFPWLANVPGIMRALCRNKQGWFVGSNNKFEERWSKSLLGFYMKRWLWDTMIAAHVIDNRGGKNDGEEGGAGAGLSGLKFQAFVRLGQPSYDDHIKPYLEGEGSYGKNNIKQIPIKDLLMYNGLDAILSYFVAKHQMEQMGHPSLELMQ